MKQQPPDLAARLVTLLGEIEKLEKRRNLADVKPYLGYSSLQAEIDACNAVDRRLAEIKDRQNEQKQELQTLARALAQEAIRFGIDWTPVTGLAVRCTLTVEALDDAKISAIQLEAILTATPPATTELNDTESNIIEALGEQTLRGEELAKKADYDFNSNLKSTLSSLKKRGVLGNDGRGYYLKDKHLRGQDKGQD